MSQNLTPEQIQEKLLNYFVARETQKIRNERNKDVAKRQREEQKAMIDSLLANLSNEDKQAFVELARQQAIQRDAERQAKLAAAQAG